MTGKELQVILINHKKWLNDESGGKRADLRYANLRYADLRGADLSNANLSNAKLDDVEKIRKGIILNKAMRGYKRCKDGIIVELTIPKGAVVFSINNNKCRTNKCKVKNIYDKNGNVVEKAFSKYDKHFAYHIGDKIEIEDFNLMYNVECATGIHFFRTLEEAKEYDL